jgi:hypothetical protein
MGALQRAGRRGCSPLRLDAEQLLLDPGGVQRAQFSATKGPSARRSGRAACRAATFLAHAGRTVDQHA